MEMERAKFGQSKGTVNKKGISGLSANPLISWCLGPDLNRHGGLPPRDFKSLASTNSATQAVLLVNRHSLALLLRNP